MADNDDKVLPDEVAAALLEASAPVEPSADAAKRMRAKMFEKVREENADSSADLVTVSGKSDDWFEAAPGNHVKVLRSDEQTMSIMVRLEAGSTFPQHYHPEDEETYVVEGETWFGDIHLVAGDFHLAPKGTTHGEVRTDTGCVLLIRKVAE